MIKNRFLLGALIFAFVLPAAVFGEYGEPGGTFPPGAEFIAAYRGDAELLRAILATGVDVDARNGFGDTALHVAMFQKNLEVVRLLLEHGYDPNAIATRNGHTPLHNTIPTDNIEAARLLLQFGADRNIRNLEGRTPLAMARSQQRRALIFLLHR